MKSEWLVWKDWRGVWKMESMDCLSCRARFKHMRYFCKIKGLFLYEKSGEEPGDYLLKLWLKCSFSHCIFPDDGDNEAEFGMSWCAGFGGSIYSSYFEVMPKQPGFEKRSDLYMLYHYLNHYNLFNSGY